ncbi:MAG: hypothetical protein QOF76_5397 [Solirubrobacteraceae bacterium]|jgi:DNA-binding transcriptional ArsR family regulator|nr:hypothetical protein [Solirubrobacteraceae bacterium]
MTPSPNALRALSHPVRLRMLGLLRHEGPATATMLAQRLGLNTGSTSFHLRSLHQHGFIVEDEARGNGRDRWWRAAHQSTRTDPSSESTPEGREAVDAFVQSIVVVHTEALQRAVEELPLLPPEWREASTQSDRTLKLTPARAKQLTDTLVDLIASWDEDDDAEVGFTVQIHAFPRPGTVGVGGDG